MRLLALCLLAGAFAWSLVAAEKPDLKKASLTSITGISEAIEAKLNAAGINNENDLLAEGATAEGREETASRSGLPAAQILKFVQHADLLRIKGVGAQTAELLQRAGVQTVAELAQSNASSLSAKLIEVNASSKFNAKLPNEQQVAAWIEEAKTVPKLVSY
jgi:predicted flap endonuclease-1-like 5' DNA nuclease